MECLWHYMGNHAVVILRILQTFFSREFLPKISSDFFRKFEWKFQGQLFRNICLYFGNTFGQFLWKCFRFRLAMILRIPSTIPSKTSSAPLCKFLRHCLGFFTQYFDNFSLIRQFCFRTPLTLTIPLKIPIGNVSISNQITR